MLLLRFGGKHARDGRNFSLSAKGGASSYGEQRSSRSSGFGIGGFFLFLNDHLRTVVIIVGARSYLNISLDLFGPTLSRFADKARRDLGGSGEIGFFTALQRGFCF